MKKHLLILPLVLLIGAGCNSITPSKEVETNQEKTSVSNTKTEPLIFDSISDMENPQETKSERTLPDHKDLALEYSQAILKTNMGDMTVKFYGEDSPVTVNNFLNLAEQGFYDGIIFHRVIKDFMIQGGDPEGIGIGGPGYKFGDEFNNHPLVKGSLAMANSGPNTNGSQFFIVTAEATPWLDGIHTNFGYVVDGMDVVMAIDSTDTLPGDKPASDVIIESVELVK